MKVYELIRELMQFPSYAEVKTDNGKYLEDIKRLEKDSREYVILRNDEE